MRETTHLALTEISIALEQQVDPLWDIQNGEEVRENKAKSSEKARMPTKF